MLRMRNPKLQPTPFQLRNQRAAQLLIQLYRLKGWRVNHRFYTYGRNPFCDEWRLEFILRDKLNAMTSTERYSTLFKSRHPKRLVLAQWWNKKDRTVEDLQYRLDVVCAIFRDLVPHMTKEKIFVLRMQTLDEERCQSAARMLAAILKEQCERVPWRVRRDAVDLHCNEWAHEQRLHRELSGLSEERLNRILASDRPSLIELAAWIRKQSVPLRHTG